MKKHPIQHKLSNKNFDTDHIKWLRRPYVAREWKIPTPDLTTTLCTFEKNLILRKVNLANNAAFKIFGWNVLFKQGTFLPTNNNCKDV